MRNPRTTQLLFFILTIPPIGLWAFSPGEKPVQVFSTDDGIQYQVEAVATDLEVPWSLAFSGEDLYFTERPGRLKVLRGGGGKPIEISGVPAVRSIGEGGLMGLAFHPDFPSTHFVYLSHTYSSSNGTVNNRVVRYRLFKDSLKEESIVVDNLPGGNIHNGCRIRFGPDKKLYITTGDAARREVAQSLSSLGGKILRINDDGSVPADNPFKNSRVFSLGHRNPQGIDWNPRTGKLYVAEHGPSGFDGPGGGDEVNVIQPGGNYGWPVVDHQRIMKGMISPLLEFTPAIAPAGACFCTSRRMRPFFGDLLVATLRGRHILRVRFSERDNATVIGSERMIEESYGRIRDIVNGPDGAIYFCTSNRDGRGNASADDDRILRILVIK